MITTDYLIFADICKDNYFIMAKIIKEEVKQEFKFAKILDDLQCDNIGTGRLDKFMPAIEQILERPAKELEAKVASYLEAPLILSYDDMVNYCKMKGFQIIAFKSEATLLYFVDIFKGKYVKDYLCTMDGMTEYEAMKATYTFVSNYRSPVITTTKVETKYETWRLF